MFSRFNVVLRMKKPLRIPLGHKLFTVSDLHDKHFWSIVRRCAPTGVPSRRSKIIYHKSTGKLRNERCISCINIQNFFEETFLRTALVYVNQNSVKRFFYDQQTYCFPLTSQPHDYQLVLLFAKMLVHLF
jgi:hypothetical protein